MAWKYPENSINMMWILFQLVTYGSNRQEALDVMVKALDSYVIKGNYIGLNVLVIRILCCIHTCWSIMFLYIFMRMNILNW